MKYINIKKFLLCGGLAVFSVGCDESFDYLNEKNNPPTLEVNDLELNDNNEFNATLTVNNNNYRNTFYKLDLKATDVNQNIKSFVLSSLDGEVIINRVSDSVQIEMDKEYSFSKAVGTIFSEELILSFLSPGKRTFKIEVQDNFGESSSAFFTIVVISINNKPPTLVFQSTFENGEPTICDGGNYTFDASNSSDEDGSILAYEFILNGDTILTKSSSVSKSFYAQEANNSTVTISVRVFDDKGLPSRRVSASLNINR